MLDKIVNRPKDAYEYLINHNVSEKQQMAIALTSISWLALSNLCPSKFLSTSLRGALQTRHAIHIIFGLSTVAEVVSAILIFKKNEERQPIGRPHEDIEEEENLPQDDVVLIEKPKTLWQKIWG